MPFYGKKSLLTYHLYQEVLGYSEHMSEKSLNALKFMIKRGIKVGPYCLECKADASHLKTPRIADSVESLLRYAGS